MIPAIEVMRLSGSMGAEVRGVSLAQAGNAEAEGRHDRQLNRHLGRRETNLESDP